VSFAGAKLMLFLGEELLVIRRDEKPEIPWPGYLDFPGGGREGEETPEQCALRETFEEVGLDVTEDQIVWSRQHGASWFFVAHLPGALVSEVRFGDEGHGWWIMPPEEYVAREDGIPHFRELLNAYLTERG